MLDIKVWQVPVLTSRIYSVKDNMPVEDAASDYELVIRQLVKVRTIDVCEINDRPKFDLILLTMGSDGQVASLFPRHKALRQKSDWVTHITDSSEAPQKRITFTIPVLNSAANVAVVATGEDKAKAVQLAVADGDEESDTASLPVGMFQPTEGKAVWFLDMAASSLVGGAHDNGSQILERNIL